MKLFYSFFLITFFLFSSCQIQNTAQDVTSTIVKKVEKKNEKVNDPKKNQNTILYIVGDPYFIEGVQYTPEENYNYLEQGLATFYGKELHNVKTINNEYNKVTELYGRHNTLPIPSIVKITNLENGLSLIIRINDRHNDNSSIIQVSRKVSQLLRFYSKKIARVKIEIQADASKQIKVVTQSMSEPSFDETLDAVPTEDVFITNLDSTNIEEGKNKESYTEEPIEIFFEEVPNQELYLKIYGFKSYDDAKKIVNEMEILQKMTTENDGNNYNMIIGPMENIEANKLVSSFISKGYKKTEIIFKQ